MEYLSKVSLENRVRRDHIIKISLVGSISLLGVVLGIYSIFIQSYLFALWYFLAFFLGLSYVVMRINTCFPTFVAIDEEKVTLSHWENGVMPYSLPENPNFFSDFIPEKVVSSQILTEDIALVLVGSKKLLAKHLEDSEYPDILKRLEENKHYDNVLKRMDFIYISTKNGEHSFMSVTDFDMHGLSEFLNIIEKNCNGVQVLTNIPKLVRLRNKRVD